MKLAVSPVPRLPDGDRRHSRRARRAVVALVLATAVIVSASAVITPVEHRIERVGVVVAAVAVVDRPAGRQRQARADVRCRRSR